MFESDERLRSEIADLLEAIRHVAAGRYACVLEPGRIVFETAAPEGSAWVFKHLLEERSKALFAIPSGLAAEGPMEDVFGDWDEDEFFIAFINGRVAVLVACPEAEPVREKAMKPLAALADRLFRHNQAYRFDAQGRGLFFGKPKLDLVVVGRTAED